MYGTIELLEAAFSLRSVLRVYEKRVCWSLHVKKGNPMPGGIIGPPCSWGYKYGDLALQVGGVSDETVKYGLTSTKE
jgi:hypothetical protein